MNVSGSTNSQSDPVVGALRIASGVRRDAAPCAVMLVPPPRVARGREGERFFILIDLTGPATPHFALQIRNRIARLIEPLPPEHPARVEGEQQLERLTRLADNTGEPRGPGPGSPL